MSHSVCSDVAYIEQSGRPCEVSTRMIYRSVWDRLCQQLFGALPLGLDSEDQLPDITIWEEGVVLVDDSYPYTFRVTSPSGSSPKPCDVVLYKGRYYVIGAVD